MDLPVWVTLLILSAVVALSLALGHWLARRWRMDDYGMSISLVIGSMALAAAICVLLWPPKLGIDLSGGVILIYEIDEEATQRQQVAQDGAVRKITAADIVPSILMRLNPSGLEDVVVRPYGDDQVEVIIPHVDQAQIDRIKNIISQAGFLEFRIVAEPRDPEHDYVIEAALDEANRGVRQIRDESGEVIGVWAHLGVEEGGVWRMSPLGTIFRNGQTGEVLTDESGGLRPEILPADPQERNSLMERMQNDPTGVAVLQEYLQQKLNIGPEDIDVLMVADDGYNVRGSHVDSVSAGFDERGYPSINFTMTADGAILFQGLTGENAPNPQTGLKRRLGILMDNRLISAPELRSMISDSGQITGRFTQEEVDDLVQIIRGGSLPAALTPQPTSESQISPLLGGVTIRQSAIALTTSMAIVLLFMVYYYRFSGLVACFALLGNLLLTVAVMILLKASFTLPGIAGLVLSVGMSVDANILIFERIREELARGSKIRMALRNGFARATTTIIDSNVTTLITGVVLYAIGTDLIRGFAVTLILGILMSMFTAVFCSRVIFDVGERRYWYRTLHMVEWVRNPRYDFLGKRYLAVGASAVVIVLGLVAAGVRGTDMFDIDLVGGTSVDVLLTEPLTETELRERLEKDKFLSVYHDVVEEERASLDPRDPANAKRLRELEEELQTADLDLNLLGLPEYANDAGERLQFGQAWKIVTSIPSVEHLQKTLQRLLTEGDRTLLVMREVTFTPPEEVSAATPQSSGDSEEKTPLETEEPASQPDDESQPKPSATPATPSEPAAMPEETPATPPASEPKAEEPTETEAPANADPRAADPKPPMAPGDTDADGARRGLPGPNEVAMVGLSDFFLLAQADGAPAKDEAQEENQAATKDEGEAPKTPAKISGAPQTVRSKSELTFRYGIEADALKFQIQDAAQQAGVELEIERVTVETNDVTERTWTVELPLPADQAAKVLQRLQASFANTPVFPSASKIGSKVAADMQRTAITAILLSLFGIVIYLWVRFQRVAYGLAAVIATVHDALIALAAIALSAWLSNIFGFLLVENFKISLSVIAAFLTLIGYSLNDTIVTFDRVREIRGKSPHINFGLVNESVNQTLSRTLLTAGTTLVTILILYIVGGQGIRSFAFTMLVGIVAGTYSSIYIAAPVLLWLTEGVQKIPETAPADEKLANVPADRP